MPLRPRPPSFKDPQPIVQLIEQSADPERVDARRGQLDRQRKAIESPANLGRHWRIRIAQAERFETVGRPVDEKLDGGKVSASSR